MTGQSHAQTPRRTPRSVRGQTETPNSDYTEIIIISTSHDQSIKQL